MKTLLHTSLGDLMSVWEKMRMRRLSLFGIAILALSSLSSCMIVPHTASRVDKTKPIQFVGGVPAPNAEITIQAYDPQGKIWENIGKFTSASDEITYENNSIYYWVGWLAIPEKYWAHQECASTGESALIRSKWGEIDLVSAVGNFSKCYFDHPGNDFLLNCLAPESPNLRVHSTDYRDFGAECVQRINAIRAKEGKPLLQRYKEGECDADYDAKYNYENGTHTSTHGAQNECETDSSIAGILDDCLDFLMYKQEKICFQQNPPNPPTSCYSGPCWKNDDCECGHFMNMVTCDLHTKVACGLYKTPDGRFKSVQNYFFQ